jgi:Rieske 2Fe-2S family protein
VLRPGESALQAALAAHRPGHALAREFHTDAAIYSQEIECLWRRSWLFAGFSIEAQNPGDFFRFELEDDSLVVVRGEDGNLHAFHNTCRHRGMRVCEQAAGNTRRWVCPYHQWSYALDGALLGAGGLERELDLSDHGLLAAPLVEVGGLIYVWPSLDAPEPFAAQQALAGALAPQGLDRARIAHRHDYEVRANWKLVYENNRECWHCHVGHPQYVQANFDAVPDNERNRALSAARADDHRQALGDATGSSSGAEEHAPDAHDEPGLYRFPTPGHWWSANRTPLVPGFVTESLDGTPVSTLMGDYTTGDVGTLRVRTVPNMWMHASSDHAVVTRLLPGGPGVTHISVRWLVDQDAQEGEDYTLEKLLRCCRSGSSPANRIGISASATRRECAALPTSPAPTHRRASTTSRRSSTGT